MKRLLLPTLFVVVVVTWLAAQMATDLRDWLDSDTWAATRSTHFNIQPKTSRVTFGYEVDGQEYSAQRTHFFSNAPYLDDRHLDWLNAHRRATGVTVYYDPDAPERAVLVREVKPALGIKWMFVAGYVCLLCLLPVVFVGLVRRWLRRWLTD